MEINATESHVRRIDAVPQTEEQLAVEGGSRALGRAGTLALIAVGLFVAFWPLGMPIVDCLLHNPREEARTTEARSALGAMKDRARVVYQRNAGLKNIIFDDLGVSNGELDGSYFKRENFNCGGTPGK